MESIDFLVQGSAEEPYKVTFQRTSKQIVAFCTCPAGENGQYCKHRFNILAGGTSNIVSNNLDKVAVVVSWLPGTALEAAITELHLAEREFERINNILSKTKKKTASIMRGSS